MGCPRDELAQPHDELRSRAEVDEADKVKLTDYLIHHVILSMTICNLLLSFAVINLAGEALQPIAISLLFCQKSFDPTFFLFVDLKPLTGLAPTSLRYVK